jgi:hypothetical protein
MQQVSLFLTLAIERKHNIKDGLAYYVTAPVTSTKFFVELAPDKKSSGSVFLQVTVVKIFVEWDGGQKRIFRLREMI